MPGKIVDILKYIIGIDDRELQKGAKSADRTVQNMSQNITKALGAVSVAFLATFGVHQMRKLAEGIGDFAFGVTLTAARTEVLEVVLKRVGITAGHSFDDLKQLEGKIKDLGITTQVARTILIRLMQTNLDLSYATKIATAAQNLGIIAGQNTAQAAETLTMAVAAQRPILLKQFGIMTNLNDIYAKQAKLLGKAVDDLTEMERRQSFVNEIMEQAARVQGIYTDAMEKAGKKFTSIPRHAEEAANAIGNIFLPVFGQMVDDVTRGFKDIKVAAEDETAVKEWGENLLLLYQPLRLSFLGIQKVIGLTAHSVRVLKFELFDLPLALAGVKKAIEEATKPFIFTGPEQFIGPIPKPEVVTAQLEQFSDAVLKTRIWLLNQFRKYDKINEVEYLASLQRMLADTRYTEEQKALLRRAYLEQLLQMEKTYGEGLKALKADELEFVIEHDEKMAQAFEDFIDSTNELLNEAEEKRIEQLERQLAFELSIYQALGDAAGRTFSDIFTSGKSLTDALKDGWKSFMDSVVNIFADMLAKFIYTSLAELARHTATEKAKTAITAAEAAKRAAISYGGPFGLPLLFFKGGGLVGMQSGGFVEGARRMKDNVLVALSAGEFVVRRPAVDAIGRGNLNRINRTGQLPSQATNVFHIDMGGMSFSRMDKADSFFIGTSVTDQVTEIIKEAMRQGKLEL